MKFFAKHQRPEWLQDGDPLFSVIKHYSADPKPLIRIVRGRQSDDALTRVTCALLASRATTLIYFSALQRVWWLTVRERSYMRSCLLLSCALALSLAAVPANAQVTGSISGAVLDPSGAGVPNTTVTITELDTRQTRSVVSDDRGTYRALALPVGRYEVRAERAGFKTAVRTGISLVVAQEAVVNL